MVAPENAVSPVLPVRRRKLSLDVQDSRAVESDRGQVITPVWVPQEGATVACTRGSRELPHTPVTSHPSAKGKAQSFVGILPCLSQHVKLLARLILDHPVGEVFRPIGIHNNSPGLVLPSLQTFGKIHDAAQELLHREGVILVLDREVEAALEGERTRRRCHS